VCHSPLGLWVCLLFLAKRKTAYMTPTEPRNACIKLLAEIDQMIAECEDLAF
jgi:hypothetical protein